MLTFLRKIRKSLIGTGSGRYLLYAIGEIALVVIGILIALQINNWNENQKLKKQEYQLVSALKEELLINRGYLKNMVNEHSARVEKICRIFLNNIGPTNTAMPVDSFHYLLERLTLVLYAPTTEKFEQVINGDDFNIIRNDSLRILFSMYNRRLKVTQLNNDQLYKNDVDLNQYKNENYSRRNTINNARIWRYRAINDIGNSAFKYDHSKILSDPYFENLITARLIRNQYWRNRLDQTQEDIDNILQFIEKNYGL